MAPAKKQSREVLLRKKRENEKRRLEKIKGDPDLKSKEAERNRLKYLKRKETGKARPICDETERQKRLIRKRWKINAKNSRKAKAKRDALLTAKTPQTSSNSTLSDAGVVIGNVDRKVAGRKKVRKDRASAYRKLKKAEAKTAAYKKGYEKYKKKFNRLRQKISDPASPRSATRKLLQGQRTSPGIRRQLFVGAVLHCQLVSSYNALKKKHSSRDIFRRVISGKIIRKYRCIRDCQLFLKKTRSDQALRSGNVPEQVLVRKRRRIVSSLKGKDVAGHIMQFLELDANSRMCPGKRDTITRKVVKKQKRYFNDTLKNLHVHFCKVHYQIGYSLFCKLRPFWIVQPQVSGRDTCLCVTHENMKLLVHKMSSMKIIYSKTTKDVVNELCCDSKDEKCLLRQCTSCKENLIMYLEFSSVEPVDYLQWTTKREKRLCKNKEITVQITAKTTVHSTLGDMANELESRVVKFITHLAYITHQYVSLDMLKEDLPENGILIHIDFSENFACKYNEEAQSVHFGASRAQVTLHTGVYYYKVDGKLVSKSFCSLSKSLRHDPSGIWAHMRPVLEDIRCKLPGLTEIHFLSGSPATQYRNKKNFYLFSSYLPTLLPILQATWNFSEAGHGKGAPDGIGAVLKRTADRLVAEGNDIADFEALYAALLVNCKGVQLFSINEEAIDNIDMLLNGKALHTFVGTMKVHQATWSSETPHLLSFRSLSCFECATGVVCDHFGIGDKLWAIHREESTHEVDVEEAGNQLDAPGIEPMVPIVATSLHVGDWVSVTYEGVCYPGEILKAESDGFSVNVMEYAGKGKFKWPTKPDVCCYQLQDINKKILQPVPCGSRASQFYFEGFP